MPIVMVLLLLLGCCFSLPSVEAMERRSGDRTGGIRRGYDIEYSVAYSVNVSTWRALVGSAATLVLGCATAFCFLAAAFALFGAIVPARWWPALIVVGAAASALLSLMYPRRASLPAIAIDAFLLWGVLIQHWTPAGLGAG